MYDDIDVFFWNYNNAVSEIQKNAYIAIVAVVYFLYIKVFYEIYTIVFWVALIPFSCFTQPPHIAHIASAIQKIKAASKVEQIDEEGVFRITVSKELVKSVQGLLKGATQQLPLLIEKYQEAQYLQAKKLVEEYEKKNILN